MTPLDMDLSVGKESPCSFCGKSFGETGFMMAGDPRPGNELALICGECVAVAVMQMAAQQPRSTVKVIEGSADQGFILMEGR